MRGGVCTVLTVTLVLPVFSSFRPWLVGQVSAFSSTSFRSCATERSPVILDSSSIVNDAVFEHRSTKPSDASVQVPNERAELLNVHLQTLLSEDEIFGTSIKSTDIMQASIEMAAIDSSTRSVGADPRFGRPALNAYHSFVFSDRYHGDNAILLEGLAPKTAKQIYNMVKQRMYKHKGILEPPKTKKSYKTNDSVLETNPPQHFRDKIANSIAKGERRARERSKRTLREVCSGCSRPFNLCLCDVLSNETAASTIGIESSRIIILQHPNEFRKKHTSTVPLLQLVLGTENVRIKVGYEFTKEDLLDESNNEEEQRPIMLFPGPDAIDLDEYVTTKKQNEQHSRIELNEAEYRDEEKDRTSNFQKKTTLVLIDGTWAEAKRIIRKSPEILEACQMVQFAFDDDGSQGGSDNNPPKSRSIYDAMRKEPEEHCLSTLEACGQALRIIEGETRGAAIQNHLNVVLSRHVELHLKNARESAQSRHNRDTTSRDEKLKRAKQIERTLYGNASDYEMSSESMNNTSRMIERQHNATESKTSIVSTGESSDRLLSVGSDTSVTIRRLTHEDIPLLDSWWENGGTPKSMMTITRSINADYDLGIGANLGIVDSNDPTKLVACILRYESGPLGALYVDERYRGKGYGTALLMAATRILMDKCDSSDPSLQCTAFIKDGNIASEKVFEKVGWVREDPTIKKRTGRRRCNRKWIYPPQQQ